MYTCNNVCERIGFNRSSLVKAIKEKKKVEGKDTIRIYDAGYRYCTKCSMWFNTFAKHNRCLCCKAPLRYKPAGK